MRVIVQRVKYAKCHINGKTSGEITKGFMLLVGFKEGDEEKDIDKLVKKIQGLRIFDDENGKMNLNLHQVNGDILSISQFTLYGESDKGYRPSFVKALNPQKASKYYDLFNEKLRAYNLKVETGIFGADMQIELVNDGPITIILDSEMM